MTYQLTAISDDWTTLPKPPGWVTSRLGETPQNVAFLSGASFAMLDVVLQQSREPVPKTLLANTLALKAAVATPKLEGRLAREADIRDAYHLTPPDADGIAPGPRSPRPGAPHTFVTTPEFLAIFDLQNLRDLPELQIDCETGASASMGILE